MWYTSFDYIIKDTLLLYAQCSIEYKDGQHPDKMTKIPLTKNTNEKPKKNNKKPEKANFYLIRPQFHLLFYYPFCSSNSILVVEHHVWEYKYVWWIHIYFVFIVLYFNNELMLNQIFSVRLNNFVFSVCCY